MHLTRQRISKLLYSCTSAYCACSEQSRLPWCGGEHPVLQMASPPVLAVSSSQSQILHCKDIKETDRRIQITGHRCVLPDIFTVLNQQTQRVSVPYWFCSADWEPVHHLQHAQKNLPAVYFALQHKHQY